MNPLRLAPLRLPLRPSPPARRIIPARPGPVFCRSRASPTRQQPPRPHPTPSLGSPRAAPSFSQRMRKLSREYGWAALGVYVGLSVLDFPFCFLAVRMLGTDRIGYWEHLAITAFWDAVHTVLPGVHRARQESAEEADVQSETGGRLARSDGAVEEVVTVAEEATIWTQLALAYAIHKSFIFIRVPLTAAVTPKVVRVLRRWGWDIGKRKPKAGKQ